MAFRRKIDHGARLVLWAPGGGEARALAERLAVASGTVRLADSPQPPEGTHAVLLVGPVDASAGAAAWKGTPVFAFAPPAEPSAGALAAAGVAWKTLGIELRPEELDRQRAKDKQALYRTYWIVAVSLLITVIGIANAMLMSVTERVREIGTMKCLGALPGFVVKLFLIECSLIGLAGSLLGCTGGLAFSLLTYSYMYGVGEVFGTVQWGAMGLYFLACLGAGVVLAIVAGIYPARVATKMIPASALRATV